MRQPFPLDVSTDSGRFSRPARPSLNEADAYRRECELCERRTWCRERHELVVCSVCEREYLP